MPSSEFVPSSQPHVPAAETLLSGDFSRESNIDLSFDVPPLRGLSEDTYEFLKRVDICWSIFEPCKEIEGLAEIATELFLRPAATAQK